MDKNRLLSIQLTNEVQPKTIETRGADWIAYGDGEYKNAYPMYLIDLYNNSATHAAVINATAAMIAGENIVLDETEDLQQYVDFKKFMNNVGGNCTLHELTTKIAFDLKLQGGFALNIIWSKDKSKIAEVHHVPVEQVRVGKPDEHGKVHEYYISSDWAQYRRKEHTPQRLAAFNLEDRSEPSQLLYTGLYSPALELYHTPDYVAATNWVQIDNLASDFHLNNISNGFSASYFINFANGVPTAEERRQIEHQITQKFSGANNAGKFVLTFSDDQNSKPEIIPIQVSNADKQYTVLSELAVQNIMIGHRVTSPMLLGVKTEGQLGGRGELLQAHELYTNTVIKPFQSIILKTLRKILAVNGITLPISIEMSKPLNSMFDAETLKEVLTQDEIRAELGYAPLEKEEQTQAEESNFSFTEDDALDMFLAEYGEDEDLENWELVDEEDAEGEAEEFDFEYNLEKLELATTGRAIPNAKSEQDGEGKDGNLYRVRYYYNEDKGLKRQEAGNSREFCKKMLAANKVYRKEDILRMGKMAVNKGWGAGGADTYSIWLYKGGGNCHHRWYRRIYVTKAGERPMNTDSVVSVAKARSKGFKPEPQKKSERSVAIAPKRRADKGFIRK
jgi:hypothetical protein